MVSERVAGEYLVVEGWIPDYAIREAVTEFKSHPYKKIFVTGEPLSQGSVLVNYATFAEVGAATLRKFGVDSNSVVSVPAQYTRLGRTRTSAMALRTWLMEHNVQPRALNIMTIGPHSRRTRLLYGKVLGKEVKVGVLPVAPADYDPKRWWRYSAGDRAVISELIGYVNARLFGR